MESHWKQLQPLGLWPPLVVVIIFYKKTLDKAYKASIRGLTLPADLDESLYVVPCAAPHGTLMPMKHDVLGGIAMCTRTSSEYSRNLIYTYAVN